MMNHGRESRVDKSCGRGARVGRSRWRLLSGALFLVVASAAYDAGGARDVTWNFGQWTIIGAAAAGELFVPRSLGPRTAEQIAFSTNEAAGTTIISTANKTLDFVLGGGQALRYRIGVGREGFGWTGTAVVGRKAEWPEWRPPPDMLRRTPFLPKLVPSGPLNPLGARAIYLHMNGQDTLYRIHGTNDVRTVGGEVTSGCFRMTNSDVIDLYRRIAQGAKVIVQ